MLSGLSEFPTDHFFFQFSFFEKIGNMTTNRSMPFIEIFDNIANKKKQDKYRERLKTRFRQHDEWYWKRGWGAANQKWTLNRVLELKLLSEEIDEAINTFINATLELESAIRQHQRAEAILGDAVTTLSKKVDIINQHIDIVMENAPTKLKVSVNINDADWQKIQELFAKERQWMTAQMQIHIREVNSMFTNERKKVRECYKEYDGCYLGHYAQWFFWLFFTIGIFVVAGGVGVMIAKNFGK